MQVTKDEEFSANIRKIAGSEITTFGLARAFNRRPEVVLVLFSLMRLSKESLQYCNS